MIIGEFSGRVDEKKRVAFPKKFRKELGEKLIITKGYEQSLIIVSEAGWRALLEGTEGKPFIQFETREVQRFLLGSATDIELDTKGRFILPEFLKAFAGITQEIVFLGLSRYVEVWSKERWDAHREVLEKNIGRISERLVPWEIKKQKHE
ncbi:MAG: hypothetical protein HYT10_01595 [Candidatus Levybacteria bacterium]|nr:hypothetical protein [Candidatus Levybacteria bacterium]